MTHPSEVLAYAFAASLDPHAHAMEPPQIVFTAPEIRDAWAAVLIGCVALDLVAAFSPALQFLFQRRRRAPVHPFRFGSSHVKCDREIK